MASFRAKEVLGPKSLGARSRGGGTLFPTPSPQAVVGSHHSALGGAGICEAFLVFRDGGSSPGGGP